MASQQTFVAAVMNEINLFEFVSPKIEFDGVKVRHLQFYTSHAIELLLFL